MIKKSALLVFMGLGLLAGCSTMNSEFSCNETTWDRCLDIEEVDAMTRFADSPQLQGRGFKNSPIRGQMKAMHQTGTPVLAGRKTRDGIVLFNHSMRENQYA